ncbi:putative solute carrier family 22 member 31 isoform X2 [Crotalus tigris]|uniref:putative solute carrier family 22 member 31 isoform X2 n=1 Tax=Crotalus tigris TaxID=88082 RepID=UPI00192F424F|nr:putative solute carrier family 22 member 31 isoform X2 [Crotalus tigris]
MDFEGGQLRQVGGFGRRSRFLAAASGLPNAGLALGLAAGLLLAAVPPHRCRPDPALLPAALRNASSPELRNASAPPGSRCLLYRYPRPGGGSGPPNGTGPCTRGWQYVLPAAGLRSTLVTQWDLVCAKQWQVPLEQTTHLLGWLMGYAALGASCDRFGRRTIFVLSLVLSVPLGFGVALAVDYLMLVVLRMLFGAVLAGGFLSLYVARLELCDPPHRLTVTMSASFFWVAGQLILPGLAVAVAEWRLLQGAITLGLALLTACWWSPSLFPESARWLLATQQLQRGKRALLDLARGNGVWLENDSTTGEPFSAETDSRAGGVRRAEYHSVCRIFSTRVVWKNSLILGFTAFIGSGIRHCFARNLAPYAPHFYFPYFLLAGSEAVAILFLCLTVDHFGRRALLLFGTILTGVSSLLLLALMQYLMAWLVLALSILGILASQAVATLSIFFASEVLPTVVRDRGLAAPQWGCFALQRGWAGPHPGCTHTGPGGHPDHGHPAQPGVLLAPRGVCLLRHPLGAQCDAPPGDQPQAAARLHAGGGEPAPAAALPPHLPSLPPPGPAATALHPRGEQPLRPRELCPPGHGHQEDAGQPWGGRWCWGARQLTDPRDLRAWQHPEERAPGPHRGNIFSPRVLRGQEELGSLWPSFLGERVVWDHRAPLCGYAINHMLPL